MNQQQIEIWQRTLEETFKIPAGGPGRGDSLLAQLETEHYNQCMNNMWGFRTLTACFQDFCIQTFSEAEQHGHTPNIFNVAIQMSTFQRLRSSLIVCLNGYYFNATANLRAVFENVFGLGTVFAGKIPLRLGMLYSIWLKVSFLLMTTL